MKASQWSAWRRKQYRSLVKRAAVPMVHASDSYIVQHLPEWMRHTGFDFAALRALFRALPLSLFSLWVGQRAGVLVLLQQAVEEARQVRQEDVRLRDGECRLVAAP